jgi:small-conductance mechanosensitive channel
MMREMIVGELTQAMQEFARGIAHFLPRLLVMLIIALLGWVCAYLVKIVLRRILRFVKFDRLSENAGAAQLLTQAALPTSTELLSRLVFWITWFGVVLAGLSALGIVGLQEHISRFLLFLPRLLAAVLIFFIGMIAASFLSRAALLAAVNANLRSARVLSYSIRVIILALTVSMAFEEIGVAENTILVAFSIVFGAVMFGLAIAFGLGGQDLARKALEKKFAEGERKDVKEDELSAL